MIYLKNISEEQTILVPRNGEMVTGDVTLVMCNTTDHQEVTLPVREQTTSQSYVKIAVALPEGLADGEYQYTLKDGNILVSQGLLYIGDLQSPMQNEKIITYKQYESE